MHSQKYANRIKQNHAALCVDAELDEAKEKLADLLGGSDDYYNWSSQLPDHIILNRRAYLEAIRERIAEYDRVVAIRKSAKWHSEYQDACPRPEWSF